MHEQAWEAVLMQAEADLRQPEQAMRLETERRDADARAALQAHKDEMGQQMRQVELAERQGAGQRRGERGTTHTPEAGSKAAQTGEQMGAGGAAEHE